MKDACVAPHGLLVGAQSQVHSARACGSTAAPARCMGCCWKTPRPPAASVQAASWGSAAVEPWPCVGGPPPPLLAAGAPALGLAAAAPAPCCCCYDRHRLPCLVLCLSGLLQGCPAGPCPPAPPARAASPPSHARRAPELPFCWLQPPNVTYSLLTGQGSRTHAFGLCICCCAGPQHHSMAPQDSTSGDSCLRLRH